MHKHRESSERSLSRPSKIKDIGKDIGRLVQHRLQANDVMHPAKNIGKAPACFHQCCNSQRTQPLFIESGAMRKVRSNQSLVVRLLIECRVLLRIVKAWLQPWRKAVLRGRLSASSQDIYGLTSMNLGLHHKALRAAVTLWKSQIRVLPLFNKSM